MEEASRLHKDASKEVMMFSDVASKKPSKVLFGALNQHALEQSAK
jgi:hypothetical protein